MCDNPACTTSRIIAVMGKCSDMCVVQMGDKEHEGYVPDGCGIGGGDYIEFDLCLDCGKIQGHFPLKTPKFAKVEDEDEEFELEEGIIPTELHSKTGFKPW